MWRRVRAPEFGTASVDTINQYPLRPRGLPVAPASARAAHGDRQGWAYGGAGRGLVLPNHLISVPGPAYSPLQLAFVSTACLGLYVAFLFIQTNWHRAYFLPVGEEGVAAHAEPSGGMAIVSLGLLLIALLSVVLLAKSLAPALEAGVVAAGAPLAIAGVIIAAIVLLPETAAAVREAARNRLQASINLALGSAVASIGLAVPAVALVSSWAGLPLDLGISSARKAACDYKSARRLPGPPRPLGSRHHHPGAPTNADRLGAVRGGHLARPPADGGLSPACRPRRADPVGAGGPDLAADQRGLRARPGDPDRRLRTEPLAPPCGRGPGDLPGALAGREFDRPQCRRRLGQRVSVRGQPPGVAAADRRTVRAAGARERRRSRQPDRARRADSQHDGDPCRLRRQHRPGGALRGLHAGRAGNLRPQDRRLVRRSRRRRARRARRWARSSGASSAICGSRR